MIVWLLVQMCSPFHLFSPRASSETVGPPRANTVPRRSSRMISCLFPFLFMLVAILRDLVPFPFSTIVVFPPFSPPSACFLGGGLELEVDREVFPFPDIFLLPRCFPPYDAFASCSQLDDVILSEMAGLCRLPVSFSSLLILFCLSSLGSLRILRKHFSFPHAFSCAPPFAGLSPDNSLG